MPGGGKVPPQFSGTIGMTDPDCYRQNIRASLFGATLPISYFVTLRDGAIDSVTIRFDSSSFGMIAGGLIEKYGPPSRDVTERVQNRMGATFDDRTVEWNRPDGQIRARERAGSVDTSTVEMSSSAAVARVREGITVRTSPRGSPSNSSHRASVIASQHREWEITGGPPEIRCGSGGSFNPWRT
jgi:hypothetical protein